MSGRDPGGYGSHESLAGGQTEQNGEAEAGAAQRFCRWQIVGVEVHYKSVVCEQCGRRICRCVLQRVMLIYAPYDVALMGCGCAKGLEA